MYGGLFFDVIVFLYTDILIRESLLLVHSSLVNFIILCEYWILSGKQCILDSEICAIQIQKFQKQKKMRS